MSNNPQTLHAWMQQADIKSDAELSRRLGGKPSRSQVSRIRRGVSTAPPETAKALESLTGIPALKFLLKEAH